MNTDKDTPEKFKVEFDVDHESFVLRGPERPYRTGGTVRDIISMFSKDDESHADQICDELNSNIVPLIASAPSLKEENEKLKEEILELQRYKIDSDIRWTDRESENKRRREALGKISVHEPEEGYHDEWVDAKAYRECQSIATAALNTIGDENAR